MQYRRAVLIVLVIGAVGALLATRPSAVRAAPGNDQIGGATVVNSLPNQAYVASQWTHQATRSGDDPTSACFQPTDGTVWYRYTPSVSHRIEVVFTGTDNEPDLAIFAGSPGRLSEVACTLGAPRNIELRVTAGTSYYLMFATSSRMSARLEVTIWPRPPAAPAAPDNDELSGAREIRPPASVIQDTTTATGQGAFRATDPAASCVGSAPGHTVWYRFRAETGRGVNLRTEGSLYDTVLAVYTGPTNNLTQVACNDDDAASQTARSSRVIFTPTRGQTYFIMIGAYGTNDGGHMVVSLNELPPANDDFDRATTINALPFLDAETDSTEATGRVDDPETGCVEPHPLEYGHSVWYRYTPDRHHRVTVDTARSQTDTVLAVYTGTLGALTEVACNDDSRASLQSTVTFDAVAGTTYSILVGTYWGRPGGPLRVSVTSEPPSHDAIRNAVAIEALPFNNLGDIANATVPVAAPLDPDPSCAPAAGSAHSVWYRYESDQRQLVIADTIGSAFDTLLAVYANEPGNLVEVACNDDAAGSATSRVIFPADAGGTYYLMVRSAGGGAAGPLTLRVEPPAGTPPPAPVPAVVEAEPAAFADGAMLYYNPNAETGSFTLTIPTDPESGITAVVFPAIFGDDGGTDEEAPFEATYTWAAGATAAGAYPVTSFNAAGLSASGDLTLTPVTAGPVVAITAPTAEATIAEGQEILVEVGDVEAGSAGVELLYCAGPTCDVAAGTMIGAATTEPYAVAWVGQPVDGIYTLVARATDNVGNLTDAAPVTITVANTPVDETAPDGPTLTLSETESAAHADGATLYYDPSAAHAGAFTVTAVVADAESGIAAVAFPALFGDDGTTATAEPYAATYHWSTGATAAGEQTVTATNGAGQASSATFTLVPDSTNPTAAISAPTAGGRLSANAMIAVEATDQGSGVARVQVRYCPGTRCAFARGTVIGTDAAAPFRLRWANRPANGTYTLVAQTLDRVGRKTTSAGVTITVRNGVQPAAPVAAAERAAPAADTTAPAVVLTAPHADATIAGVVVLTAEATDAVGVIQIAFQVRSAGGEWRTLGRHHRSPAAQRVNVRDWADGVYKLRALATDAAGNLGASDPVTVRVSAERRPSSAPSGNHPAAGEGGDTAERARPNPTAANRAKPAKETAATASPARAATGERPTTDRDVVARAPARSEDAD